VRNASDRTEETKVKSHADAYTSSIGVETSPRRRQRVSQCHQHPRARRRPRGVCPPSNHPAFERRRLHRRPASPSEEVCPSGTATAWSTTPPCPRDASGPSIFDSSGGGSAGRATDHEPVPAGFLPGSRIRAVRLPRRRCSGDRNHRRAGPQRTRRPSISDTGG